MVIGIFTLVLVCVTLFLTWKAYQLSLKSKKEEVLRRELEGRGRAGIEERIVFNIVNASINPKKSTLPKVLRFLGVNSAERVMVDMQVTKDGVNPYPHFDVLDKVISAVNIEGISCEAWEAKIPTLEPAGLENRDYVHFEMDSTDVEYCKEKLDEALSQVLEKIRLELRKADE